jgi:hypothetical protein
MSRCRVIFKSSRRKQGQSLRPTLLLFWPTSHRQSSLCSVAHDCSAQLTNKCRRVDRASRNLTSRSPAHLEPRCLYCENLTLEPFDQSIPSSYTTQHIIQNGNHHRREARWYVSTHSQTPKTKHPADTPRTDYTLTNPDT